MWMILVLCCLPMLIQPPLLSDDAHRYVWEGYVQNMGYNPYSLAPSDPIFDNEKLNQKVSIVRFMPGDVRIYHKDNFSGVILDQLGFARPEGQDQPDFAEKNATKERIPAMDGDILFYFTYDPAENQGEAMKLEQEWINDPLFNNLKKEKPSINNCDTLLLFYNKDNKIANVLT